MDAAVTEDALLGGAIVVRQPKTGFRVAIDTIFLAAAVPAEPGERVFEPGAGVGAAALCLAHRVSGLRITGVEMKSDLVRLAGENIRANGFDDAIEIMRGDIAEGLPPRVAPPFDHVMMNPPYLAANRANAPPDPGKADANVEGTASLEIWVALGARLLSRRGTITMIHRADRLDAVLATLTPGFGDIHVIPLWPRAGEPARRVVVRARRDIRTPLTLSGGLALHEPDGAYTEAAAAVLGGGALMA